MKLTISPNADAVKRAPLLNGLMSPAEATLAIAEFLNTAGAKTEERDFIGRDVLTLIPQLEKHNGTVLVGSRSGRGGIFVQGEENGEIAWAYTVNHDGEVTDETEERRQDHQEAVRLAKYFEVKSIEEGLYGIIRAVAEGRLSTDDLMKMSNHLNTFPPVLYLSEYAAELTPTACKAMIEGISSPKAFKGTAIFQKIMSDKKVLERFRLAAAENPGYWPEEVVAARRSGFASILGL